MLVIPALELRGGSFRAPEPSGATASASSESPIDIARTLSAAGFHRLHLSDIDGEAGRGSNEAAVEDIARDLAGEVQASGGVNSSDHVHRLFDAGVARVVVGSRALEDTDWVADLAEDYPGLILVGANAARRQGRSEVADVDLFDLVREFCGLQVGGLLTSASRGALCGRDLTLLEELADACTFPLLTVGGVGSMQDLRALEHRGVAAAIVSSTLFGGSLDPHAVVREFAD